MPIHTDLQRLLETICNPSLAPTCRIESVALMGYIARNDSKKGEHEGPHNRWCIRPRRLSRSAPGRLHLFQRWVLRWLLAWQADTSQARVCLCRIVKMHHTSELASAATATSPRWKRCITGFAFLSRLTAASKHFSTYLLPILLEVSTHFLDGACFLEGTEVTCHFLSHVT